MNGGIGIPLELLIELSDGGAENRVHLGIGAINLREMGE